MAIRHVGGDGKPWAGRHKVEDIDPPIKMQMGAKYGLITERYDDGAFFSFVNIETGEKTFIRGDGPASLDKLMARGGTDYS